MAKAKLSALTERWIDGKTERQLAVKTERRLTVKTERQNLADKEKVKLTLHISKKAVKALRYNRAETGKPMSSTIEQLILEHIEKGKRGSPK